MKKILLSIFGIITLGLLNFGFCENVAFKINYLYNGSYYIDSTMNCYTQTNLAYKYFKIFDTSNYGTGSFCFRFDNFETDATNLQYLQIGFRDVAVDSNNCSYTSTDGNYVYQRAYAGETVCLYSLYSSVFVHPNTNSNTSNMTYYSFDYQVFKLNDLLDTDITCPSCSQCENDLQSCQSSLATATGNLATCQSDLLTCQNSGSSCPTIDTQYCMINGLCPSVSGSGTSNIYIYSDNQYTPLNSASNIYVNLPSYVGYNYSYSNGGNDLDIDVGIVVDEDYIDGLNTVQNYKPTSEDFTELIGILAPYSKILIFCLFMFIVWAWIKKPFKSKKL